MLAIFQRYDTYKNPNAIRLSWMFNVHMQWKLNIHSINFSVSQITLESNGNFNWNYIANNNKRYMKLNERIWNHISDFNQLHTPKKNVLTKHVYEERILSTRIDMKDVWVESHSFSSLNVITH